MSLHQHDNKPDLDEYRGVDTQEATSTTSAQTTSSTLVDLPGTSLQTKHTVASTYRVTLEAELSNPNAGQISGKIGVMVDGVDETSAQKNITIPAGQTLSIIIQGKFSGLAQNTVIKGRWCVDKAALRVGKRSLLIEGFPDGAII